MESLLLVYLLYTVTSGAVSRDSRNACLRSVDIHNDYTKYRSQMKRTLFVFVWSIWLFSGATAIAQSPLERIVITYPSRSIASVDLYIAQERGFFRQEGLLADVVQVRGNIGVTALLSGDAHAINNVGTLVRAMERSDLPAKVVSQSLKKNLFWLVTKPEIKNITELKGKT